jgi:hypothetical protein
MERVHKKAQRTTCNGRPESSPLHAALLLLEMSIRVIDLPRGSKHTTERGWQDIRLDAAELRQRFPSGVSKNVGVLLGGPSGGLIDVDLDCKEARRAGPLFLPATGWVTSRKGARFGHRFYRVVDPPAKASEGYLDLDKTKLAELRSTGGQTVIPPSFHKETGCPIYWEGCDEVVPPESALPTVDLADLRGRFADTGAAALIARHWPAKGGRDEAAMALAGGLLRAGWEQERIELFVYATAHAAGDEEATKRREKVKATAENLAGGGQTTGWPTLAELLRGDGAEVVKRAREWLGISTVAAAKAGNPPPVRLLPPYVPFPVHTLAAPLAEYVNMGAETIGCDPSLIALPVLTVAAGCIGHSRALQVKPGWVEPSILWCLTVAPSGGLKTAAYQAAVSQLRRLQVKWLNDHKIEVEIYQHELATWKDRPKGERGDRPVPPPPPLHFLVGDVTFEAVGELMSASPRGVLLVRDELDTWFSSFTRYRTQGTERAGWLEFHTAGPHTISRKSKDCKLLTILRTGLCLCGGIQPVVLKRAFDFEAVWSGLAARFLLAMPPRQLRTWRDAAMSVEGTQRYGALLQDLLALPLLDEAQRSPVVLGLTPDALARAKQFVNYLGLEQYRADESQAAGFAKIEAYAFRLALVHHVVTMTDLKVADPTPVGSASLDAGIEQAMWFAAESRRVHLALAESPAQMDMRHLVEWLMNHGGRATANDVRRYHRRFPDMDAAAAALDALAAGGFGHWEDRPASSKGGRPTRTFVLHAEKVVEDIIDNPYETVADAAAPAAQTDRQAEQPAAQTDRQAEQPAAQTDRQAEQPPAEGAVGPPDDQPEAHRDDGFIDIEI